ARTIELTASAALQFTDADGAPVKELAVTPGETLTIKVTNSAGFAHNFYIGTDQQLQAGQNDQMTGIPDFNEGTQEVTWTVPDDVSTLRFGCTVPGHYQLMNGSFTTGG
ncbi:MAG: plastocyanin/azurin family copper-binding protein, partial [Chloroflexota bacterium]